MNAQIAAFDAVSAAFEPPVQLFVLFRGSVAEGPDISWLDYLHWMSF